MARETYKQTYAAAKLDLLEHLQKRDALDQKIRKLKQTVKALGELCGAAPEEIDKLLLIEGFAIEAKPGFTDAIRRLFRIHQTALSPNDVREDLIEDGDRRRTGKSVVIYSYGVAAHGRSRRN